MEMTEIEDISKPLASIKREDDFKDAFQWLRTDISKLFAFGTKHLDIYRSAS